MPATHETGRFGPPEHYDQGSPAEIVLVSCAGSADGWLEGLDLPWNKLAEDWLDRNGDEIEAKADDAIEAEADRRADWADDERGIQA